ncbi:MAG: energy transducer TonB [Bacteroidales bacterium]|nr:energy transducer TonB [Candidatus Latescibacterota bacterium]
MLTVNAKFKGDYKLYIGRAVLGAIAIHFALFYLIPPFTFSPYRLAEQPVFDVIKMEPIIEIEEPPEVKAPALVPVVKVGAGEVEDEPFFPRTMTPDIFKNQFNAPILQETVPVYYAFDKSPVLIRSVRPEYPELARLAGVEGDVLIKALLGTDGKVISAVIIHSSVTSVLERAAIAAVMQFLFEPARQGVVPVQASIAVPVSFRLN